MGQKVTIMIWWESGLSSASRNHLTTFCRLFAHYACSRVCNPTFTLSKTIVFTLSAKADRRKVHKNVGLENMNLTSNYDVTNKAHQIKMAPYATE